MPTRPARPSKTRTKTPSPVRPRRKHARAASAAAGAVTPIKANRAPGMQALNAYLAVANIAGTMTFLEHAFGFSRGVVLPGDNTGIRYAEMRLGNSVVMLTPRDPGDVSVVTTAALYAYVDDMDLALARAREAGCHVGSAEDKPWGDKVATVTDHDGHRWLLASFRKLAPFQAETERRKGTDRRQR